MRALLLTWQKYSDAVLMPVVARVAQMFEVVHGADAKTAEQTSTNRVTLRSLAAVLAAGVSCVGVANFVKVCPLKGGTPAADGGGGDGGGGGGGKVVARGVAHSREWVLNFLTSQLGSTRRKPLALFQGYFLAHARECSKLSAEKAEVRACVRACVPACVPACVRE